jgi:diguanylate cyclase (GGDEF)-like protein
LGWQRVPVELLVAVLFLLSVVVAALLLWVFRADHVKTHWPGRADPVRVASRPHRPGEDEPAARRRSLYVADRVPSPREAAMSGGFAPTQAAPAEPRRTGTPSTASVAPFGPKLPPDLAEILSRPAAMAPLEEFDATEHFGPTDRHDGHDGHHDGNDGQDGRHDGHGTNLLARIVETGRDGGAARLSLDPLTGLEGASSWTRIIENENARLLRYRRPVTVVLAEVEGLRRLSERLGQEPIERLLPVIGDVFRREARSSDWVARLGAGRFAVFLPETDEIQAINYVERIRTACEPWLTSSAVPLRLAVGWSSPGASSDIEHAIAQAEARMHSDRRVPGKSPQPARPGPARVVSLAAGSPATDGLSELTEIPLGATETGRPPQWAGKPLVAADAGVGQGLPVAGGAAWNQSGEALGRADETIPS